MKRSVSLLTALLFCYVSAFSQKEVLVNIATEYGDMIVKLYNDTPTHRDNFVELVKSGHYNGTDFHRVIKQFMIQGGGSVSHTLSAEILPHYHHKLGALAAARLPDHVNPEKKSSGCQFYIVSGKVYPQEHLKLFEQQRGISFSEEQMKDYTTIGGTPFLDGDYTVFGEMILGVEVLKKISSLPTNGNDRPINPVKMKLSILE